MVRPDFATTAVAVWCFFSVVVANAATSVMAFFRSVSDLTTVPLPKTSEKSGTLLRVCLCFKTFLRKARMMRMCVHRYLCNRYACGGGRRIRIVSSIFKRKVGVCIKPNVSVNFARVQ